MKTFHRGDEGFLCRIQKRNDEGIRNLSGDTNIGLSMLLNNSTKVRSNYNESSWMSCEWLVVSKNKTHGVNSFQMLC